MTPIVTLDDAKLQLGIPSDDTSNDQQLQEYVAGITAAVENYKGEVVGKRSITERLNLTGRSMFRLWRCPVIELTSLKSVDGSVTWPADNFDVDPDSGLVEVLSGSAPTGRVIAVYDAGYDSPPQNYIQGALVILQHVWETQRGPGTVFGGVVGSEEENGHFLSTFAIPRKALEWLGAPRPVVA